MKFIQTHSTGSDETAPFDVTDYKAKNLAEFVDEVLKQCPNEWGSIYVKYIIERFHFTRRLALEYRYGKLLSDLPLEWKSVPVSNVKASGGWSSMNYYITYSDDLPF